MDIRRNLIVSIIMLNAIFRYTLSRCSPFLQIQIGIGRDAPGNLHKMLAGFRLLLGRSPWVAPAWHKPCSAEDLGNDASNQLYELV